MTAPETRRAVGLLALAGVLVGGFGVACSQVGSQKAASADSVEIDAGSIGGVVVNGGKPEAGVWVIAETDSLPTHFTRIVVTDDQGRFVVPDLPAGNYDVWVRGYGLRDSERVKSAPGQRLTLQATTAASPQEAAKIYPANYWLSLYEPPKADDLPLVGEGGEGHSKNTIAGADEESGESSGVFPSRHHWVGHVKLSCMLCHQLGQEITRLWTREQDWDAVWERAGMVNTAKGLGRNVLRKSLADWASRIAAGEVPPAPPRPSGVERNMVVTQWAWGQDLSYIHDNVSTDKRQPTLYPYGKVWGIDIGQSYLWALDPVKNTISSYEVPVRNGPGRDPERLGRIQGLTSSHNPMLDDKGNVWLTTRVRDFKETPKWAMDVMVDIGDPSGANMKTLPPRRMMASRHLGYFDSKSEKFVLIDTAFATHHLQFDKEGRLWTSGDGSRLGMFDPSKFDASKPEETEASAQTAFTMVDAKTGKSAMGGGYGIIVSPVDGTVWRANYPGIFGQEPLPDLSGNYIDKFDPKTKTYKRYEVPLPGYGPRGIDVTTDGILWFATGSGHLGRFDPKTEQFKYWETPGPKIKGTGKETGSADFHYYIWADQFNTLGLGKDVVMVNGSNSDSVLAFNPTTEQFTVIRVPAPVGLFTRGLDGRIDDEKAGWKGRGLWLSNNTDGLMHTEKKRGYISHVQFRPDPLAR
jgi:streptogramin lyase